MPDASGRKRLRRAIAIAVVLLAVVVAGLAAVSQTAAFRAWLRGRVVARMNAAMTGRLVIGGLDGNLFGGLVATDVRLVFEGRRVLAIRKVAATYDALRLVFGDELRIRSLAADGVAVQLVADERGWNVERLAAASAERGDRPVSLDAVRITRGSVRVVRPGRGWRLRDLTLAGHGRYAPAATDVAVTELSFVEQGSRVRLADGRGRFTIDPRAGVTADGVRLRTSGSELTLDGRLGPRDAHAVDAHLRVVRLAGAELRALLGPRAPSSDWSGELHAAGPAAAVVVTGNVRAEARGDEPREVGRGRIDGLVDVRATPPAGELAATLEHVDLGGIAGPRWPPSDLTGMLTLTTKADAPSAVGFALDLRDSRIGATTVTTLTLGGTGDSESVRFDATARAAAGAARLAGTVAPKAERFDLHVTATDVDPAVVVSRPELAGRVSGTLTLAGEGFTPATTRADLALTLTPGRVGEVTLASGDLAARAANGRLVVERGRVATSIGDAEASGSLALGAGGTAGAAELRGEARVNDLRPLATLLGRPGIAGAATLTVAAAGVPGARTVRVEGRGRAVTLAARTLADLTLAASWQGDTTRGHGRIDVQASEGEPAARHRLTAEATHGGGETRVTVATLRLDHRGRSWVATGTPVVMVRGDRLTISDLALRSAAGGLRLEGALARTGDNDLTLDVDGLELDAVSGFDREDASGRVGGRVHLGGTLAAPRLEGDLAMDAPTFGGVRYDELRARVVVGAGKGEVHGRLQRAPGEALVVDGTVPVHLALAPWRAEVAGDVDARLRADGIDVAFLGSLWPGLMAKVGGTMSGDIALTGPWRAPEARGTVALARGRAYVVPLGLTYDPVELELRLDGRAASIHRLAVQSGNGRLTGGGDARFGPDGPVMDARFEATRFPLFANQYGHGAASGWLWISGSLAAPVLEGSLETDGLVLQIPEVLPTAVRPPDPTIVVIGPGAPPPPPPPASRRAGETSAPVTVPSVFDRAAIRVEIAVPRDAWVRRSDANVELKGWMTAWKKPEASLRLAGDIRGVRGWYTFQGKKFTLEEGSVRFSGHNLDPVLDIAATHKAGDYLVRLRVGGTITKPTLALESEPALAQADVLAVLLFGAPAGHLSKSQATGLREQALGIAGSYVAAELRQSVASALGVDDLQFDTGTAGLEDARVSVGKYVAEDIFVSLAHRFGAQSVEELRIEYVIRPEWSLETSTDTLGRSGIDLFWKRRY